MQVIVPDPSYDHEEVVNKVLFLDQVKAELSSLSSQIDIRETNLGRGADWPAFLIEIGVVWASVKLVNETLDTVVSIAKKFNDFLEWILSKCVSYRVDESGATLIAIGDISESAKGELTSIDRVSSTYVPFTEWVDRHPDSLSHHPDGIYTQTYVVNGNQIVIYAIKSDGKIESKSVHKIELLWG